MAKIGTLKTIWATADNKYETETSSVSNVSKLTDSWERSESNDSSDASSTHSEPEFVFRAKGVGSDEHKNEIGSETLEDFEAIPEEFRPNKPGKNLLPIRAKPADTENTVLKWSTWDNKLKPETPEIKQPLNRKSPNSHLSSKVGKEQRKHNYVHNHHIQNKACLKHNQITRPATNKRQKELHVRFTQMSISSNAEDSGMKDSKEGNSPSVTVLSQVTKLEIISPGQQAQTKKTVQTWATNASAESTKNIRRNKNGPDKVLIESLKGKVGGKKMTWMDDLCTVRRNGQDNKTNVKYISRPSSSYSQFDHKNERPQLKGRHFSDNAYSKNGFRNDFRYQSKNEKFRDPAASEFVRAQYQYSSDRERQNMPQNRVKDEVPVIRHEVKVIHVNQPRNQGGGRKRWQKTRNNRFTSNNLSHPTNKTPDPDLSRSTVTSVTEQTQDSSKHTTSNAKTATTCQFPPKKRTTNKLVTKNRSKTNVIEERSYGLLTQSKGIEGHYSLYSTVQTTRFENPRIVDDEDMKHKRSLLIHYGEEISDTIVGSYTAMNMFLSFYKEWKNVRVLVMQLFEDLIQNITNRTNRNRKMDDVVELFGYGGKLVAAVPDVRAALAGRIIASLSEFIAKLFRSSSSLQDSDMNEFQLMLCLEKDIDATSAMNIYGLQCDQQFQETCKVIEEFHNVIQGWCFKDITDKLAAEFLQDISSLNPKHNIVYYRRLQKWLERLSENPESNISKAFCRGFKDWPDALETTNLLHWRFHVKGLESSVNLRSWDEIRGLLQNGNVTANDVLLKLQNIVIVLVKERSEMEKDVMELLKHEK